MALTLEEMRAVLRRGESVMHGQGMNTRIISREEDLPSEAELAHGDREKLEAARTALVDRRSRLDAEIAAVESELAGLSSGPATGATSRARKTAGPAESGDENTRSQVTAAVGTAQSDAAAGAEKTDTSSAAGA